MARLTRGYRTRACTCNALLRAGTAAEQPA